MLVTLRVNLPGIGRAGQTVDVHDERGHNIILAGLADVYDGGRTVRAERDGHGEAAEDAAGV